MADEKSQIANQPKINTPKHSSTWHLKRSVIYLILSVIVFGILLYFLNHLNGLDGVMLEQPKSFFGLLVLNVYLLATGLNHLISYFGQ